MARSFTVSSADRVVYPEAGVTKGAVVDYYEQIAPRLLPHVESRPLSVKRYPKGLGAPGFFQKNVPPHYPESITRLALPRSAEAAKRHKRKTDPEVTNYPLVDRADHLAYLANQGALELHVPTARAPDLLHPDRLVIDLDPPAGALAEVRRAAHLVRHMLQELGLETVPVATGSKGYHLVAAIEPVLAADELGLAMQKLAELLAAAHPDLLTTAYRIADRENRVFIDWLRNRPLATVVAPYSLRARPAATIATPLTWDELDTTAPDAFSIAALDVLLERPDTLAQHAARPQDASAFTAAVGAAFERAGLELVPFDRFRS